MHRAMIDAMPEPSGPPPRVARRRVLTAAGGLVGTMALAGCGIRLEHDAPDLPLIPRQPIPAEDALVALTLECAALAEQAAAAGSTPLLTALAGLHARQHDVLVTALSAKGVPSTALAPPTPSTTSAGTATPSGTPSTSPSSGVSPSPGATPATPAGPTPQALAALAAAEAAALDRRAALVAAEPDLRPSVCAVLAQRYAASALLGGRPPSPTPDRTSGAGTAGGWAVPADAVPLLTATRSAAYALEVVAAQSSTTQRRRALTALRTLSDLLAEQAATLGDTTPEPPLGYQLPFPVTTPAEADRLATLVLTRLRGAYGATLGPLTDTAAAAAFERLPWWLGRVEVLAHGWDAPLQAFAGLS